jgi:ATP-binding cassette subfamily B (MDR/TAP) protein 1
VWFLTYASYALCFWYGIGLVMDGKRSGYDIGTLNIVFFNGLLAALKAAQMWTYLPVFSVAKRVAIGFFLSHRSSSYYRH